MSTAREIKHTMGVNRLPASILTVFALAAGACGTALYHHVVDVSLTNTTETEVGVFDHQQGYSRDWARRTMRQTSASANYSTRLTTTEAVTLGSMHDARPLRRVFSRGGRERDSGRGHRDAVQG